MSIQIGDINLLSSAVDLEFRVLVLENILDRLTARNAIAITQDDIDKARGTAIGILKSKYPNMGIGNHQNG